MNDLQIAKAMAGLEGVKVHMCGNVDCEQNLYSDDGGYWPITDLALNCMLREIRDDEQAVAFCCKVTSKEDIPRAVCEVILKANGLWV